MALGKIWANGVWDEAIWDNAIWEQLAVPTLLAAIIAFDGDSIDLTFDKIVVFGAGGNGGWTLNMSGGASTMTFSSGSGTTVLVYTLSRSIAANETGDVDYTQPGNGVENQQGDDLVTFIDFPVSTGSRLSHNSPQIRHNDVSLYHLDTTIVHKDVTVEHNG